ncbi:IS630 transposase-related protein [Wolbachia endosymbiont of Bemisia tabaci]|uniref:IS630 transposase-related protein n=1 Tax=Wolbachia endosymbiont of Bemisia tabaci TaxID=215173 RepID=UPI000D55597A|nr:IS630 transposase-related protein [Wolbachia endosymbiont of Bemisia tabaci]
MASPYQYELRKRVISAVESGMTVVKAKEIFKVGRATIYRWKKIKQSTGNIKLRSGYQKGHSHIIKDQGGISREFIDNNK